MNTKLANLLQAARQTRMSKKQIEEQRINFAYGNAGEGDEGTKEAVKAAATIMRGEKEAVR